MNRKLSLHLKLFFQPYSLLLLFFLLGGSPLFATVYTCTSVSEIRTAMSSAVAGDEIVIVAGTYTATNTAGSGTSAHFYGSANGTASNPITIRSQSSSNVATLKGNSQSSLTVLRIVGDHWIVKDLKITNAQKGLIFDNANYCQAIDCEVYDIGFEGIHVRDGSDYTTIDGCDIHDTGTVNAGFGEGIYIGTDKGSWSTYDPYVDHTTVKNCTIGPNVGAEAFDIKEGTSETIVEYCTVDADGISGSNFADSFIDLKGTRTYVRYNTFNRSNENNLTKGIAVIDRSVALSSYEHAVHDNVFNMDASNTGNMVEAYGGTSDVYAWNNTRNPSGDDYNSRVTTSCCPPWYNPGSTCNAPGSLSTSGITSSAVTFNWSSVSGAIDYDIRYRVDGTSSWTDINNLSGTSHTLTGLTTSTTYEWEIRTSCSGSNSAYAMGSNFTTNAAASCNAPGSLSTSGITSSAVTFNWGSVSGAVNYDIRYRESGTSTWTNINNQSGTSHTESGLLASTTYEWEIRTSCSGSNSSYVAGSDFTTSAAACNAPGSLSTSGITSSAVTFNWGSVSGAVDYDIRYRESGTSTWTNINNQSGTSHTESGLTASTTYEWEIRTSCSGSNSSYAAGSDFTTSGSGGGSTAVVYDDALASGWNNYSYSGTYDFAHTANVQVGSNAIRASYNSWGGVNIKHNSSFSLSGYNSIRFWVKGEGSYQIRLKLDNKNYEFTTSTSWQQITVPLSTFSNPSDVEKIVFQNRSSSSRVVYYDQIEFVGSGGSFMVPATTFEASQSSVQVYPNPVAHSNINIVLNNNLNEGKANIILFDLMGRAVLQRNIYLVKGTVREQLFLPSDLLNGPYILRIDNGQQQLSKRVLIAR